MVKDMEEQRFILSRVQGAPVSTEDLLADLRRVAAVVGPVLSQRAYSEHGCYDASTIKRRFGSWAKGVEVAGFTASNVVNYSDLALFENILRLWEHLGRQPRLAELLNPPSVISQGPYKRRFRTWIGALEECIAYANSGDLSVPVTTPEVTRRSPRDPNLRQRFRVLKRDDFKCRACGATPATSPGLYLHIDHIIAWSNGGVTTDENLQTLCGPCNLGKSNVL